MGSKVGLAAHHCIVGRVGWAVPTNAAEGNMVYAENVMPISCNKKRAQRIKEAIQKQQVRQ